MPLTWVVLEMIGGSDDEDNEEEQKGRTRMLMTRSDSIGHHIDAATLCTLPCQEALFERKALA